jgi:triacylglycerol lipase
LGDKNPDFIAGVSDLTSSAVEELNKKLPNKPGVHYAAYGSVLKGATSGRFPLNFTNPFVKHFDGKNDGLVGIDSFAIDKDFTLVEPLYHRGISHGDMIDLNRENIDGFDVREFYVKLVSGLKEQGF